MEKLLETFPAIVYPDKSSRTTEQVRRKLALEEGTQIRHLTDFPGRRDFDSWTEITTRRQEERKELLGIPERVAVEIRTRHPILLSVFGDVHCGAENFNARRFAEDVKATKEVDGYSMALGDLTDSYFFNPGENEQILNNEEQVLYMRSALDELAEDGKLIAAWAGDHCKWGADKMGARTLYHQFEEQYGAHYLEGVSNVTVKVNNGEKEIDYKFVGSHQGRGRSIYHPTHSPLRQEFSARGCDVSITAHCLDDETEILTKKGWKKREAIGKNTKALTYNIEKDILEWQTVEKKYEYTHFKELFQLKTRGINIKVTPDHTILYKQSQSGHPPNVTRHHERKYLKKKANYVFGLKGGIVFPRAGYANNKGVNLSDDWIKLIAWLITEGHFRKNGAMNLFQDWGDKRDEIDTLLKRLKIPFSRYERNNRGKTFYDPISKKIYKYNNNSTTFYITVKNAKPIRKIISSKEFPSILYKMNRKQFNIFWETMIDGDGSRNKNGKSGTYTSKNNGLLDDLQALLVQNGYRSSITEKKRGGCFDLHYCKKPFGMVDNPSAYCKITPYDGIAWCVSVPNGTIVCRSNGKTIIVGNTHEKGHLKKVIPDFDGNDRVVDYLSIGAYKESDRYGRKKGFKRVSKEGMGGFGLILDSDEKSVEVHWNIADAAKRLLGRE